MINKLLLLDTDIKKLVSSVVTLEGVRIRYQQELDSYDDELKRYNDDLKETEKKLMELKKLYEKSDLHLEEAIICDDEETIDIIYQFKEKYPERLDSYNVAINNINECKRLMKKNLDSSKELIDLLETNVNHRRYFLIRKKPYLSIAFAFLFDYERKELKSKYDRLKKETTS